MKKKLLHWKQNYRRLAKKKKWPSPRCLNLLVKKLGNTLRIHLKECVTWQWYLSDKVRIIYTCLTKMRKPIEHVRIVLKLTVRNLVILHICLRYTYCFSCYFLWLPILEICNACFKFNQLYVYTGVYCILTEWQKR